MSDNSKEITILDLFDESELTEKADGNFKATCPSCGASGESYGGLIIFPKSNTSYCHNSRRWFNFWETAALVQGTISCIEGREKDE